MKRRAEIRAVERVYASVLGNPPDRAGLARLHDQLGVLVAEHREAVQDVPILFDVGDVEVDRVTLLNTLDVVRGEMAADRDHLDVDALAFALDPRLRLGARPARGGGVR